MSSINSNVKQGVRVVTANQGYIALPSLFLYNNQRGMISSIYTANRVYGMILTIPSAIMCKNLVAQVLTSAVGSLFSVGLYSLSKDRLVYSNTLTGDSVNYVTGTFATPKMMQPGTYYYCWTTNSGALGMSVDSGIDSDYALMLNALGTNLFFCSNVSVGGVLPLTLGTLTAQTLTASTSPPFVIVYA